MSELVKNSAADFTSLSDREISSAFLAGLTKMSIGGGSFAAAGAASATTGAIHSLLVKLFVMASLCLLAKVLKALTTSSIGAPVPNSVI